VAVSLVRLNLKQRAQVYWRLPGRLVSLLLSYVIEATKFLINFLPRWRPFLRLQFRRIYGDKTRSMDFSREGNIAAVGLLEEGVVHIWDTRHHERIREIPGPGEKAYSVALSPDGQLLAVGSHNAISIWDLEKGRELRRMDSTWADSMAVSPDKRLLVCGAMEGEISLWDLEHGGVIAKCQADEQESYVQFLNGNVVQVIGGNLSTMIPNLRRLKVEGVSYET
jgi:WD40 repeat protein